MDCDKLFFSVLNIRGLQPNSINTYRTIYYSFKRYSEHLKISFPEITREQILSYLAAIKSDSTRRQAIGVLNNLYGFVLGQGFKTHGLPYPAKRHELPDYFTHQELNDIFNLTENKKQRTLLKFQYSCALRVHEACQVKRTDFIKKWDGNVNKFVYDLRIIGKGGHHGEIPVPDETIEEIFDYWRSLPASEKNTEYLFKGQFRNSYSTRSVQQIVKRAMVKLGITDKYGSSHLLRHSRASHLIQAGVDVLFIKRLLRHKSIKSTEIYAGFKTNDMRVAFNKADVFYSGQFEQHKITSSTVSSVKALNQN